MAFKYVKNNTRQAFTLIEMLIVIAIIAMLSFLAISSYASTQKQAQLDVMADTIVSALKQQQNFSKSGKITDTVSLGEKCYGLFISQNEPYLEYVETPYYTVKDNKADSCDLLNKTLRDFDTVKDLSIGEIKKFSLPTQELLILFKPPSARVVLGDMNSVSPPLTEVTPDITAQVKLPTGNDARTIRFDTSSGLIERIYE